jgi:outer membrane receptor protein involved in Fe transport
MNPPLSYLDPTNVAKIKVFAGIAPVSVGGDSIGGAIVAETAPPQFAAPGQGTLAKGEVGAFFHSNNNAQGGNLSATLATENISISYTGAMAKADNYKAGGDFKRTSTGRIGHTLLWTKSAPPPTKAAPTPSASPARRQPPGRSQVRLSGRALSALPQPAHGHARQRAEARQPALPRPVRLGHVRSPGLP